MKRLSRSTFITCVAFMAFCLAADAAGPKKKLELHKTPPDLTNGGKADERADWSLGPLGVNGWVFNLTTRQGASTDARQILVTYVDKKGPSSGLLNVDDVITGANGKKFDRDARRALADAINEAEKEKGKLPLLVWRGGKEQEVVVSLKVLGSYSNTMPFNCAKTDKIIDMACEYMKTKTLKPEWLGFIDGLGMLATGRDDLLPKVKEFAHSVCLKDGETLSIEKHVPMLCWTWGYKTLFLSEYYLRTRDGFVLPTITEYSTKLAMGQSAAGTWGHSYSAIENTGHLHGHLGGYGAINQLGLLNMIGLALAKKCGVKNAELDAAIVRGNEFFGYFIGKGAIPYGDHGAANEWFDDNGKSGSAAIFFDVMGNRNGAQFFSDMILGSVPNGREEGHTGCFWSHLWGGIGAARGGDLGLQTFLKEMNWAFTLERQPDGHMVFQGNAGEGGTKGVPKAKWDCTGARLLQLCVPRRVLYITGKETPSATHLTKTRIDQILTAGRLDGSVTGRAKLDIPNILKLLEDPLPPVRSIGARILAERNINCVDKLIPLLDSSNRYARYGAAEALCKAGFASKEAADKLIKLMATDKDITLQVYAIDALVNRDKTRGLLGVAKPAIPVLLEMAVRHSPDDPREVLQSDISRALFYKGNAQPRRGLLVEYGLEGVDKKLLIPAMKRIMANQNGGTRSQLAWVFEKLTDDDLKQMWNDIYVAARNMAPSGEMFASGVRLGGVKVLALKRTKEGLELAVWYVRNQKQHGVSGEMPEVLKVVESYGAHAKPYIPELEKYAKYYAANKNQECADKIRETIKKLEAENTPATDKLVSIAQYLQTNGQNKSKAGQ